LNAEGTWIHAEVVEAYEVLFRLGHAASVETWQGDRLVGGLYGVVVGHMFFGESMFSKVPNASKAALIELCRRCAAAGFGPIDCQMSSPHLLSMGAEEIPRADFIAALDRYVAPFADPAKTWPKEDIKATDRARLLPLLDEAQRHEDDADFRALLAKFGGTPAPGQYWRLAARAPRR
jgi:Leu/Phe-tRNA-protein transferase